MMDMDASRSRGEEEMKTNGIAPVLCSKVQALT